MGTIEPQKGQVKPPPTEAGREPVPEPLQAVRPVPRSKSAIIVPSLMGLAFVGMLALMLSQPGLRSGTLGMMSLIFPFIMVLSLMSSVFMNRGHGGDKQLTGAQLEMARRDYCMNLDEVRDRIQEAARSQHAQFEFIHPEPALLMGLVGSARMGCRSPEDPVLGHFFGHIRMGLGTSKLVKELETTELGRSEDYEPVTYDASSAFLQAQSKLDNAPKPVSLRSIAGMALVGRDDMEAVYGLARSMICQAAVAHSPNDFKIMVVTDDTSRWDWLKWLPHCAHATLRDRGGPVRMVWRTGEEMDKAVGHELHNVRDGFRRGRSVTPHWLVIDDLQHGRDDKQWATLTRADGVAGVTFMALAETDRQGFGFADDSTYLVGSDVVMHRGAFFCRPDFIDDATARALARKVARYRPKSDQRLDVIDNTVVDADVYKRLGIADPANLDVQSLWAPTLTGPPYENNSWGKKWLQIPVGVDSTGATLYLDLKESHLGGMGNHVLITGTTGSGKSSFLISLILGAALTHSPETLVFAVFDFKGKTLVNEISESPNVIAAHGNLKDDSLGVDRMGDVTLGELERRKMMLARANVSEAAEYEYRRIHLGQPLEPMPALIIVVDEFTQMFIEHPDSKKIIDEIGRQGRALHVGMILGSQRLGHEMQTGIMANIPIRIALRALDATESMAIIGTDEAAHLPEQPAGAGLLRVGRRNLVRFQAAYVRNVYHRPQPIVAATVRSQAGYMAPEVFTVDPMALMAAPAAVQEATPHTAGATVIGPEGRPLREIEVSTRSLNEQTQVAVHQMWLPPLAPIPVDELVRRLRRKPWHEAYGVTGRATELLLPVGIEDRPFLHLQTVYSVNMGAGHCAVVGRADSGKTTALATMITGAALMYHPSRVQFFVIAMGGPILYDIDQLPHVGGVARGGERDKVLRMIAEIQLLVETREDEFSRLGITIDQFRDRKFDGAPGDVPGDPFGEVILVIDGWKQFRDGFDENVLAQLAVIMGRGSAFGVRVIVSADGWIPGGFPSWMAPLLVNNVELALIKTDERDKNNRSIAVKVPFGERELFENQDGHREGVADSGPQRTVEKIRGRGTSMNGFHFQTGFPTITTADGHQGDIRAAAAAVVAVSGVHEVAQVQMLPAVCTLDDVFGARRHREKIGDRSVPFGISEVGLTAAEADFGRAAHLLFVGNPECGKSTALATVATSLMRVYTPDQAQIYVVDPQNSLVKVVQGDHLGRYIGPEGQEFEGYVYHQDDVRAMATHVAGLLAPRLPRKGIGQDELASSVRAWTGPEIYVIVDNEETISGWGGGAAMFSGPGPALEPLTALLERGRDIGLHFVVARRLAPWGQALSSSLTGKLISLSSPTVVMDGPREEGSLIRSVRASRQPVGRGVYVTDKLIAPVQIADRENR